VKAAIVDAPGSEPRLGQVSLSARSPGQTLVEVLAAPLNRLDLLIASGTFHSARHEAPYVPGAEFVGTVLESESVPVGALVYGECHPSPEAPGALAERVIVADSDVLPLPASVDPVQEAAIGNVGVAAYLPLVQNARLRTGDTVLVLGATGAVGQLAVQVAHLRGADRVIGIGRDPASLAGLVDLGADAVVELHPDETVNELASRLAAVANAVDVVFDGLYGLPLEAALQVCARGARIVNVGHLAGPDAVIPAGTLRGKQLTLSGFAGLHTSLQDKREALEWLWAAQARGELRLNIRAFSFEELPDAWRAQAGSPHGKAVLVPESRRERRRS
jgi:NADPH2:quinone reductase